MTLNPVRMNRSDPTWLFVPGDRPDRFVKAAASRPGQVILDLEDAVDDRGKGTARDAVASWLSQSGTGWVRVNGARSSWIDDDLQELRGAAGLSGVVVPKAESALDLADIASRAGGLPVVALIESAKGIRSAYDIADAECVERLAFGSIDLAADVGCDESDTTLMFARSTVVIASRAAGKEGPIDGVTTSLRDGDEVRAASQRAAALGFGAKLCIHPAQLEFVREGFRPSDEEVAWALSILSGTTSTGATGVAGRLVDRPVVIRAETILDRAGLEREPRTDE
jgi:citrate lyase subunit beta / citryl-CoA lyase